MSALFRRLDNCWTHGQHISIPSDPTILPHPRTAQSLQRGVSETCSSLFGEKIFYKNEDGAFIGPFAPLLYTPGLVDPVFKILVELG